MDKERAIELWQDYLMGDLSSEAEKQLNDFLSANPEIKTEFAGLEDTWKLFDQVERPEPSSQMDARFYAMMASQGSQLQKENPLDRVVGWLLNGWQVGLASLVVGLFIGWWLLPTQQQSQDIAKLTNEVSDMKTMMMLTLIEQPKAQDRIQAVNLSTELDGNDDRVIEALVSTLNMDENLNVRLSALESLSTFHKVPYVRRALVEAIASQDNPLMQVAIADVLVKIQAKNSVEELEKLKESIEDELVKDHLEESIRTLKNS